MANNPDPTNLARATVPLFYVDFESKGRLELATGITLAELNAREAERVRSNHGYFAGPLSAKFEHSSERGGVSTRW